MSILWEKSAGWRWLVRRTRDSKPFFFTFAALCGVVPGVVGYGVMQLTSSRNDQLEAHLRSTARPETADDGASEPGETGRVSWRAAKERGHK
ncbi:Os02g0495900 [Oryza sativa Japonica Group]|uniref:Os02g0495900 protein n=1 Tax=Oryza sativa subsp. japonica TaxID=39947 RepID=Q0E136_ORYSJ|nr:Os02g0495900 [Oryza sativa Japonica Group]|eukprot:NP_001046888.2 Os02g0495900 [Oryza sativa Japonica Group]